MSHFKHHVLVAKLFLITAVGTILACLSCSNGLPPVTNTGLTQTIEMERSSVVALVEERSVSSNEDGTDSKKELRTYCSGVWISEDTILTAYHCVRDKEADEGSEVGDKILIAYYTDLRNPDGKESYFKEAHASIVVKLEPKSDLALLRVKKVDHSHNFAYISQRVINDGDSVMIVGHPSGLLYTWINGTVAATRWLSNPHDYIVKVLHITSPAWFGNSGGPAFDMEGHVVGIASFIGVGGDRSFFIHRDIIVKFLARDDKATK